MDYGQENIIGLNKQILTPSIKDYIPVFTPSKSTANTGDHPDVKVEVPETISKSNFINCFYTTKT
jgi:hypothetical protein